jgi:predicted ABC-type ATPase
MARGSRLRMIGGPNGSGKSTLLDYLSKRAITDQFPLGFVQNPDAIEREIAGARRLFLGMWGVRASQESFSNFVRGHALFRQVHASVPTIIEDALVFGKVRRPGYLIPIICDFFRQQWIASGESFTFETVMSGSDKLDVLRLAKRRRYRTYLYYVCTDDISINRARIANRVKQGGHAVPLDKLSSRYDRSLEQLRAAIKLVDRVYAFDNSGKEHRLIATCESGRVAELYEDPQPRWFVKAVLNKLRPRARRPSD